MIWPFSARCVVCGVLWFAKTQEALASVERFCCLTQRRPPGEWRWVPHPPSYWSNFDVCAVLVVDECETE